MNINLNKLEIDILLKCNDRLVGKTQINIAYSRHPIKNRQQAVNNLIQRQYIIPKEFPAPGAGKTPIFYEITEKGSALMEEYLKKNNAPKKMKIFKKEQTPIGVDLNTLEIRILLKCNEKLLAHAYLSTSLYNKVPLDERKSAIDTLIQKQYIVSMELPTPGPGTTPIFYEITEKGRAWVKNYMDNYPGRKK